MNKEMETAHFNVLVAVTSFLEEENIDYWLDAGTLLSAVRSGDLSSETDVDVGLFAENIPKVEALKGIINQRLGRSVYLIWLERREKRNERI